MNKSSLSKNRWIWGPILVVLLFLVVALFSQKSVKTELLVPFEPGSVWKVLMNTPEYRAWNPVLVPITGKIELGATIRYQWKQPDGHTVEVDSKVVELIENQLLHQRGGVWGVLTFDHRYQLFPVQEGTLVVQSEVYKGIGVLLWNAQQMEPEYQKVNEALLARLSNETK